MIGASIRGGWQTTLADLAMILFMVTAAAMAERPEADARTARSEPSRADVPALPASGEPIAIYRAAPGAPPLAQWLAEQPRDPRQNLTILARHAPAGGERAAAAALALAREAGRAGHSARIVIEPAERDDLSAVLDFDGRQADAGETGTAIAGQRADTARDAPSER
ncbi:hypothetical protein V5F89_05960 [Pelagerythrobacter marensis]|uniref:Biopolymer transporter ExbD n=1 Tax=Pelagerythrobacter marensis TaxID=543877 RepID=A0ABZ2D5W4_9SPHN